MPRDEKIERVLAFAFAAVAAGAIAGFIVADGAYWRGLIFFSVAYFQLVAVFNAFFIVVYAALPVQFALLLTAAFVGGAARHWIADLFVRDHNLLGIELVGYWIFYGCPVVPGVVIGFLAHRFVALQLERANRRRHAKSASSGATTTRANRS